MKKYNSIRYEGKRERKSNMIPYVSTRRGKVGSGRNYPRRVCKVKPRIKQRLVVHYNPRTMAPENVGMLKAKMQLDHGDNYELFIVPGDDVEIYRLEFVDAPNSKGILDKLSDIVDMLDRIDDSLTDIYKNTW